MLGALTPIGADRLGAAPCHVTFAAILPPHIPSSSGRFCERMVGEVRRDGPGSWASRGESDARLVLVLGRPGAVLDRGGGLRRGPWRRTKKVVRVDGVCLVVTRHAEEVDDAG